MTEVEKMRSSQLADMSAPELQSISQQEKRFIFYFCFSKR